jgi:hypothetical protein
VRDPCPQDRPTERSAPLEWSDQRSRPSSVSERSMAWYNGVMPLGPEIAEWAELQRTLHELVRGAGAAFAAVIDESANVWCATDATQAMVRATGRFYDREIAGRAGPLLRRGGRISVSRSESPPEDSYLAESFAGIYVLVVWFDQPFGPPLVQARVRRTLPRIESLTVALPPPDGPSAGAASKRRA